MQLFSFVFLIMYVTITKRKNFMQEFLNWTAWPMEPPKSYGLFHILFVVIGGIIAILLAFLLRKTNNRQNRIVLGVVGGFLILTELYKQLFYTYVIGNGTYQWWIFPFQLCSVPMYVCIICAFCKNEKFNSWLYNFMFAFNLMGGAISFAEPSGLNHAYWTLTLHAYVWHMTLVFLGFYLFFSKRAGTDAKGYLKALAVFGVCCVIAQIFNVSFKDLGGVNMFYISPFKRNPIAVFKDFYNSLGWLITMILYLTALVLASSAIYYLCYLFRFVKTKVRERKIKGDPVEHIMCIIKKQE